MPLPASVVIPAAWAAWHRPVVAAFFCDEATLERKAGTVTVDALGTEAPDWVTLGTRIPALIQAVTSSAVDRQDTAGQPIVVSDYLGRLDVAWLPQGGDRITVTGSPDPANLGIYIVQRRESQGHVVDRTVHLQRIT